jgi:hypothetical protein
LSSCTPALGRGIRIRLRYDAGNNAGKPTTEAGRRCTRVPAQVHRRARAQTDACG